MLKKIEALIEKAAGDGRKFLVMAADKAAFGDYSTNIGFILAKELGKPPMDAAKEVAEKISKLDGGKLFSKVEVAAPGFVNFWLTPAALFGELDGVLKFKALKPAKKLKINLEFVSANPTGPLTMANGRGGFLGDALANVLEAAGNKVTREYYINDAGNQIKVLGGSVLAALGKTETKEEHYQGDYVKELALKLKTKSEKLKAEEIGQMAAAILLKGIKESLKKAGIKYDVWFSEAENLHKKGEIKKVLEFLRGKGLVEDKEGAVWLKRTEGSFARPDSQNESGVGLRTADIADDKDRVLVKSDGNPTYFLADTAYHYDKFLKRKFDIAINIWGADHHGYVARLKSGVKAIGVDPGRLKVLLTQFVRLVENGQEIKMSKRTGNFVTMDELLEEVGADVARFFFLMHTPDTHMDFDLALAKEKSMKNPVYYAQYAYVRCGSILNKSKTKIQKFKISDGQNLKTESELSLIKELIKLPNMIEQTAADYQVSRVARYALDIARAFHNFYEKERVVGEDKDLMNARLALVAATRNVLAKLFGILGISTPEKM